MHARYHSHPIFAPKPSQKDAENQRNYQALFRCEASSLEPFLGAIVGPYDVQMLSPVSGIIIPFMHCCKTATPHRPITSQRLAAPQASCMTWFMVRTWQGALTPYHVRVSHSSRNFGPDEAELNALHSLIDMVRDDDTRVDFSETWRPFTSIADGQFQGPPLNKVFPRTFFDIQIAGLLLQYSISAINTLTSLMVTKHSACCLQFEKLQAALTLRLAAQSMAKDVQCSVRAILEYLQGSWAQKFLG